MNGTGPRYLPNKEIQGMYQISPQTLRAWANSGKIECRKTPGGKRLYDIGSIRELLGEPALSVADVVDARARIVYARVSSQHQKEDLRRQVEELHTAYPTHEIIQEIASGLNFKRRGLLGLLGRIEQGEISEVVVAHKDRLARFGFDLLEWIFKSHDVNFVVHHEVDDREDTGELSEDLLAVTTFFVARQNGRRSAKNRAVKASERHGEEPTGFRQKRAGTYKQGEGCSIEEISKGEPISYQG